MEVQETQNSVLQPAPQPAEVQTTPAPAPTHEPAEIQPLAHAEVQSIEVQPAAPLPVEKTLVTRVDSLDTLYNKIILNSSLLSTIHDLKTTGFTNASIPLLVLSIISTYNSYTTTIRAHALTVDDIQVLLERVYNYLVDKYNLIDVPNRLSMYNLFELSLKLCLTTPNIKKDVSSCLKFFKCKK
jgi:hypothetical protein